MTNIEQVFDNPYVRATLYILIFLYIASIRPSLPSFIKVLFLNPVFRVFILFLIVVRGNNDPIFSLALATAFVLTLTYLGEQKAKEAFESVEKKEGENSVENSPQQPVENSPQQSVENSTQQSVENSPQQSSVGKSSEQSPEQSTEQSPEQSSSDKSSSDQSSSDQSSPVPSSA
jgi:hypothetical protein